MPELSKADRLNDSTNAVKPDSSNFQTPMLKQWEALKRQYSDCLLFFRLGDFYELFGDDAKIGSEVLHITLTARDKGKDGKIAMCGVPFHASDNYIARLVEAGYKVAICEQLTEPGKGLVEREVVRVVTASTILRDESATFPAHQFCLAFELAKGAVGGAAADLSTGEFFAFEFRQKTEEIVPLLLAHFSPSEVIVPREVYDDAAFGRLLRRDAQPHLTCAHDWLVYTKEAETILKSHFGVASLEVFGLRDKPLAVKAAAALLGYLRYTQKNQLSHVTSLKLFHLDGHVVLDHATLKNLEVLRTSEGATEGSLFGLVNHTATAAGSRLLESWLARPVTQREEIAARHEAVGEVVSRPDWGEKIHLALSQLADIERLVGRLAVGIGGPRDMRRLADSLWFIHTQVVPLAGVAKSSRIAELAQPVADEVVDWVGSVRDKIVAEPPSTLDEGLVFTAEADSELKRLRDMTSGHAGWLKDYEQSQRQTTGIAKLKVVYSRAFGYAIEIGHAHKDKVPADYSPRQTLVNASRYITQELADYEKQALLAVEQMVALEKELFGREVAAVVGLSQPIGDIAQRVSQLDVLIGLGRAAKTHHFVRPRLVESTGIEIIGGRHPVIEWLSDGSFVPNDTNLNPKRSLQLLTGPNMSGKSTYLRQVALIVLLAHTGSFVPVSSATIGVTDRIFTRIGAHDNLRAGQSTFMVEMLEVAHILHNASPKSLVILDEVGRGTSPEDGFALAWAVAEAMASQGLVLFATHFHGLKALAEHNPNIYNSHLTVAVDNDDLIFLRKVVDGPTDESFGLVVAEKAGVPKSVITRAKQLAGVVSKSGDRKVDPNQLALAIHPSKSESNGVVRKLKDINIDSLTPLAALNLLASLKKETDQPE